LRSNTVSSLNSGYRLRDLLFSGHIMQRAESHPVADADFHRFLSWRAQCLERQERIEAMDESSIPDEFTEHVQLYRYGRASAIVDREGNPEAAGVAAVGAWLRRKHTVREDRDAADDLG
jgi:hypothetical protein